MLGKYGELPLVVLETCNVDRNLYAYVFPKWTDYAIPEILSSELTSGVGKCRVKHQS